MKSRENAAGIGISGILILLVLLPLAAVLFQVVCPDLQIKNFSLSNLSLVLQVFVRPLWKKAFLNSFFLSVGTTVIGLILAAVLAHIRVNYKFRGAKLLDLTAWILMVVPSFILAQGWVYFSSGNGIASAWLGIPGVGSFIFSYWGLVCVMVLCKFPMAYVTIKTSMEWYPARLMYAARMNGASAFEAWKSVQLPLCVPAYCSAAMLIFMDTVGDYGMSSTITAVYSFPTLPYTIYSAICSSPVRFDMAGVLSSYLMVMIVIAMIVQYQAMGKKKYDFLENRTGNGAKTKETGWNFVICHFNRILCDSAWDSRGIESDHVIFKFGQHPEICVYNGKLQAGLFFHRYHDKWDQTFSWTGGDLCGAWHCDRILRGICTDLF